MPERPSARPRTTFAPSHSKIVEAANNVSGPASPAPGPPAAEARGTRPAFLDIVSINAWGLPWPLSRARPTRLQALARAVRERYDVVALQELWKSAKATFQRPLYRPDHDKDSGLGLLTHLPVIEHTFHPFARRAGIERFKRKGIFAAALALPGIGAIWVAVVHTQAGGGSAPLRQDQVAEALDRLHDWAGDHTVIIAGDFNLEPDNPVDLETETMIERAGFYDAGTADPRPTWCATNPWVGSPFKAPPWLANRINPTLRTGARYDRIFVRAGKGVTADVVQARRVFDDNPVSDHYGVAGRIAIRKV